MRADDEAAVAPPANQITELLARIEKLGMKDGVGLWDMASGREVAFLEMPGINVLLAKAALAVPLYAFSNTNRAHEVFWPSMFAGILGHFRTIFVSHRMGLRKPDTEAFEHVVEAIGAPAERIVFFDDVAENVEAARAVGLQAVHVGSRTDVAAALAAIGL